ncbi:MAG: hypothetical protein GXP39_12745 [Chloroflexi bacterium]|nr:hypothetical protein [Chloroflexota bacterium]
MWTRMIPSLVALGVWMLWTPAVWAHSGAPYPVLLEEPAGPYVVSVLADPDVGTGTFLISLALPDGVAAPADTEVWVWVRPEDGHAAEAGYAVGREGPPARGRFVARVPFDAEGVWDVRLTLDGPAGLGEATFQVRVTPPGPGWATSLVCMVPFLLIGALWVVSALRPR